MAPQLTFVLATLAIGWAALFPARERLGPLGYHAAALPVGALGWVVPAIVAIAISSAYTPIAITGGLVTYVLAVAATAARATATDLAAEEDGRLPAAQGGNVPLVSYAIVAVIAISYTAVFARWKITAFSHDAWAQYELFSWMLHDSGIAGMRMLTERSIGLPALHAAYHALGGEFGSIIYPVLSLGIVGLVAVAVWSAGEGLARAGRVFSTVLATVLMVGGVYYLFQSIYMHSHTLTAINVLLALFATERAAAGAGRTTRDAAMVGQAGHSGSNSSGAAISHVWLAVAGLALVGVAFARPDGPAYSFVPLLTTLVLMVRLGVERSAYTPLFLPLATMVPAYTLATILQRRELWTAAKITAPMLLGFAGLYVVMWAFMRFVPLERLGWLRWRTNAIALVLGIEALLGVALFRFAREDAITAALNATRNLLETGGWRFTWLYVIGYIVLSVAFRPRGAREPFRDYLLFAIVQFFFIAFTVHSLTHVGRIGWNDSFSRVAFHVIPVVYWYVGIFAVELLRAFTPRTPVPEDA